MMDFPLGLYPTTKNNLISFFISVQPGGNRKYQKHGRKDPKMVSWFDCVCGCLCNRVSHRFPCSPLHMLIQPDFSVTWESC